MSRKRLARLVRLVAAGRSILDLHAAKKSHAANADKRRPRKGWTAGTLIALATEQREPGKLDGCACRSDDLGSTEDRYNCYQRLGRFRLSCAEVQRHASEHSHNSQMAAQAPAAALLGSPEHSDQPTSAPTRRGRSGLLRQPAHRRTDLLHRRRLLKRDGALAELIERQAAAARLLGKIIDRRLAGSFDWSLRDTMLVLSESIAVIASSPSR